MRKKTILPPLEISEISDEQKSFLVKILAATEILFLPFRFGQETGLVTQDESCRYFEIASRRNDFFSKGGILTLGGGVVADRLVFMRLVDSLLASGWLHSTSRSNRKGIRLRLSEAADVLLREATCLSQIFDAEGWGIFRRIAELQSSISGFVREDDAGGFDFASLTDTSPMTGLSCHLSPMLCRGWVESHSDCTGVVGYFATEDGLLQLQRQKPRRPSWLPPYRVDRTLIDAYSDAYQTAFEERNRWTSSGCGIPLSAASWE